MTTALEDTFTVHAQVLDIPLDKIRPSAANPRSDLGDLDGLAASIREVGVLQPITVIATDDGYEILYGARRHAASELAEQETIPAIVHDGTVEERAALVSRIIENLHREDPSAMDEARAFARLRDELDVDQYEIANRVGCSQSLVSKRIALLDLPERAQEMLVAKTLGVSVAVEIAKLADDPEKINEVLETFAETEDVDERRQVLDDALEDLERETQRAALIADLEGQGVTVLSDAEAARAHRVVGTDEWWSGKKVEFPKGLADQHAAEPCHAVGLHRTFEGFTAKAYCTDPSRHAAKDGDSKLVMTQPAKTKAPTGKQEPSKEDLYRQEVKAHRTKFVRDLVRKRKVDQGKVATAALSAFALGGNYHDQSQRAELLGVALNGRIPVQVLEDYARSNKEHLLRVCLAALLVRATGDFVDDDIQALLDQLGYTPTDAEIAHRAERDDLAGRAAAESDAYDALERLEERGRELELPGVDQEVQTLTTELDNGVTVERATEIKAVFEARLDTLNAPTPDEPTEEAAPAAPATDDTFVVDTPDVTEIDAGEPEAKTGCPYPDCLRETEHMGDHQFPPAEDDDTPPALTEYQRGGGPIEMQCRTLIASLPADYHGAPELQQELYKGLKNTNTASKMRKQLKAMFAESKKPAAQ